MERSLLMITVTSHVPFFFSLSTSLYLSPTLPLPPFPPLTLSLPRFLPHSLYLDFYLTLTLSLYLHFYIDLSQEIVIVLIPDRTYPSPNSCPKSNPYIILYYIMLSLPFPSLSFPYHPFLSFPSLPFPFLSLSSFPFLPFPSLSFPFLYFTYYPFLSFPSVNRPVTSHLKE